MAQSAPSRWYRSRIDRTTSEIKRREETFEQIRLSAWEREREREREAREKEREKRDETLRRKFLRIQRCIGFPRLRMRAGYDNRPFTERSARTLSTTTRTTTATRTATEWKSSLMTGSYGKTFKSPLYPAFTFSLDDFHSMAAVAVADSLSSSGGRSRRPCAKRRRRASRSRILSAIGSRASPTIKRYKASTPDETNRVTALVSRFRLAECSR